MNTLKKQFILFVVMFFVGIFFNPMNILAYDINDIYLSYTLIYSGILMASNMIWSHQIVHYLQMGHFNALVFMIGLLMSLFTGIILLRKQLNIGDKQWLKRMIGHHSTALTTTKQLLKRERFANRPNLYGLAKDIIYNQEREIMVMKRYL